MFEGRVVREIPAVWKPTASRAVNIENIAAYCRVSTDHEEQEDSFEAQCEHFTRVITDHTNWNLVKVYADPGLTGTQSESRKEFQQMIEDCRAGKIDRILVKSISRFARNTVDTLSYIRELKELGVGVTFENERIDTLTSGGEVLITILAAIAEQESRNISTNIKWAYKKRFKEGRVIINYKQVLGWDKKTIQDKNGKDVDIYEIVEDEAEIVREIYREYLNGKTPRQIANQLNEKGLTTKLGSKFDIGSIQGILSNEKYTGNAILGKTWKPDVLSKKRRKNEGQAPKFYVENSHPAIISQDMFDMVQAEKKRRKDLRSGEKTGNGKYSSIYPLSGLLVCGNCGTKFRRYGRSLASGEKVTTWVCQNHQHQHDACEMKPLKESDVYEAYRKVIKEYGGDLAKIIEVVQSNIEEEVTSTKDENIGAIEKEIGEQQKRILELYKLKTTNQIKNDEYQRQFEEISTLLKDLQTKEEEITKKNMQAQLTASKLKEIKTNMGTGMMDLLNIENMKEMLERIMVKSKHEIEFQFKCGLNIAKAI